jgi:ParB family chromosome partitioning protein
MATAVQKITLSSSRDIPFNKLVLSQSNVRRVKAGVSIEELASDIARRTLLQSLNVRPVLGEDGAETGLFEVPAGGRRFRALELLVKQKRLAKTAPVPCVVRDPSSGILAEDDSLAENIHRAPLHPLDQFRAFQALREKGQSEEDIAAAFFTTVNIVKQRLRLAAVSDKLLELYADDGLSLEQLMAFTVTDDHARQEQVWESLQNSWSKEPYQIRRMLTERSVRASDRRAVFVGLEAYEAAGGVVARDLFQQDDGGWLENVALLDSLAAARLKAEAETLAAEGWKWIEVAVEFPYGHANEFRELDGTPADLTVEEQATVAALQAEQAKLEGDYAEADEIPEDVSARFEEIEAALSAFDGSLAIDRGYIRPEDELPVSAGGGADRGLDSAHGADASRPAAQGAVITVAGQSEPEEDEGDIIRPLSDRLLSELTAHRTLALRDAVASQPHVAMTMLLHKLCLDTFQRGAQGTCLEVSVKPVFFPVQAKDLKESLSAKSVEDRHEAWKLELPDGEAALWDWLFALDEASRQALLAHCVSFGVNALYQKVDRYGGAGISAHGLGQRLTQAGRVAQAAGLDMVDAGWRPTVENYLGQVTKPRILEAVREAKGEQAAQLIGHLKKGDMAREAERLLEGTGWLPEPLRTLGFDAPVEPAIEDTAELPAFLAGDGDMPDDVQPLADAAE